MVSPEADLRASGGRLVLSAQRFVAIRAHEPQRYDAKFVRVRNGIQMRPAVVSVFTWILAGASACDSLQAQDDLADEVSRRHVLQRRVKVLEREHTIDDRAKPVLGDEGVHANVVGA
jgi:hypothetical protein